MMTATLDIRHRFTKRMLACACLALCAMAHAHMNAGQHGQPADVRAFMEERVVSERYVFPPGRFPKCTWNNELFVETLVGPVPLSVAYYNAAFQRVTSADTPGRYGAVIEGTTQAGFVVRRYITLFCSHAEFDDYGRNVPVRMNALRDYGIPGKKWDAYANREERFSFGSLKYFPQIDPDAAVFLAGLNDMDEWNRIDDTPRIRDRQWWITMQRRLDTDAAAGMPPLGIEADTTREAENLPRAPKPALNGPAPLSMRTLQPASREQKMRIDSLRTVCRAWADKSGVPHVTLVVHRGRIIFHEAFGTDEQGNPASTDARMWMASITKLLTGVLMMRFVDQGLVDLNAPVGRYLPELRAAANDKLTVRHLFTHTTGLSFAGEWASDWNPALENQIAHLLPGVDVGQSFSYHRVGYALAGKIMERISGRAVPYLFRNNVFAPLGMKTAYADNTYGGLYCTAADLARFGQMLLHKGAGEGYRLFSDETFEQMLPRKLPVGGRHWGIGATGYAGGGLSDAAFGHAAASGSVFRIDPVNDLVIISARNDEGSNHREFERALIERSTALAGRP